MANSLANTDMIKGFLKEWSVKWHIMRECVAFGSSLLKYNASVNTDGDMYKMQYTLLRENHVIEKGMSLRNPRKGFGQQKVAALLARLSVYVDKYGEADKHFLLYPLSTVASYIRYTKESGVEIPEIKQAFDALLKKAVVAENDLTLSAGVKEETKQYILEQCNGNFRDLLYSRHSMRYYAPEPPRKEIIDEALEMAQRTPSACNRQAWHTHVFMGEQSHRLLKMQQGCNGFEDEIHCAVLVTADMKGFLAYEPHQHYVDGGLYAMNLINAFHALGLGTIPLSCGFYHSKIELIKKTFGIPEHETPVVIVGVGELQDVFHVAESTRKSIEQTNTYH